VHGLRNFAKAAARVRGLQAQAERAGLRCARDAGVCTAVHGLRNFAKAAARVRGLQAQAERVSVRPAVRGFGTLRGARYWVNVTR
jgi:hypothetical protein